MINFALVGCGRIAKRHSELLGLNQIKGAKLVAVCDIVEQKAKDIANRFNIPYFIDMDKMMCDNTLNIDVVVVLSESGNHAKHAIDIVSKYQKHILVEKPMSLKLSEQDSTSLDKLFNELDVLIKKSFAELKDEIDYYLSTKFNIEKSELMPWHYEDKFFQQGPKFVDLDLDEYYKDKDVVEIVLNIKQLRFVLHGDGPVFIELKKKGPGKVYAKDFVLPSQVELLTPDQEIATLDNENAEIEIHLRIDKGKGFVLSEDIQEIFDITTVGWIPLDADFSPIKKVAFRVEDTRVGRRTDYNKLTMEIWTDGSITPKDAVVRAANILIEHFSTLRDKLTEAIFATVQPQEVKEEENGSRYIYNLVSLAK